MIEKLLITGFATITTICWLRYGCRLILEASADSMPHRLQQLMQRLPQTTSRSSILPLLLVLQRECRMLAMKRCPSCGSWLGCGACDRAVLLANFECLTCCCLVISSISAARSRGLIQEMARIVSCLAQRETAPLAIQ